MQLPCVLAPEFFLQVITALSRFDVPVSIQHTNPSSNLCCLHSMYLLLLIHIAGLQWFSLAPFPLHHMSYSTLWRMSFCLLVHAKKLKR